MATRILLVEDDISIVQPLSAGLLRDGFEVVTAGTGAEALALLDVDIVLLDLGLPDLDGRDVCRRMREKSAVAIIVVTARGDEVDRVVLLELGADDYLVKPFGFRELVARIRAVLRRTGSAAPERDLEAPIIVGALLIDPRTRRVSYGDRPVSLTPKEHDLLVYLARDPETVHAREHIIADVWDENWWGSTKTLDVHIASLRRKLSPETIETVRGVGFRLVAGNLRP
jgi:two-component system, OmpR family, response regulator RegX3